MTISTRRKFGALLVSAAVLAVVAAKVQASYNPADPKHIIYDSEGGSGNFKWYMTVSQGDFFTTDWRYAVPAIVICGASGLLFLLWPSPKPPKLKP
jgi:hypothetical protein